MAGEEVGTTADSLQACRDNESQLSDSAGRCQGDLERCTGEGRTGMAHDQQMIPRLPVAGAQGRERWVRHTASGRSCCSPSVAPRPSPVCRRPRHQRQTSDRVPAVGGRPRQPASRDSEPLGGSGSQL